MDTPFYSVGAHGITLRVKAKPRSRKDAVLGVKGGELVVAVRAVAEKGRANVEIAKVLAAALAVARDQVVLKTGSTAPHKLYSLPLDAEPALARLGGAAG